MLSRRLLRARATQTPAATVTYATQTVNTTSLSSYTFSSVALSTAASSRVIVVSVHARFTSSGSPSSVTIAGVSAVGYQTNGGGQIASFWVAQVPTGTTGTVVVTLSGAAVNCGIIVWALYGLRSPVPVQSNRGTVSSGTVISTTVNTLRGGITLGAHTAYSTGSAITTTWTGVTENADFAASNVTRSGGSLAETSAAASKSVRATLSTTGSGVVVAASWR